jgi:3D (Asp-Asp-Asp) domain-containing protein
MVILVACEFLLFPMPILASQGDERMIPTVDSLTFDLAVNNIVPRDLVGDRWSLRLPEEEIIIEDIVKKVDFNSNQFSGRLSKSNNSQYVITAYNSDVAQCDSTPCITANGFNVCQHGIEDTVAANFLPMGTQIRIPALFGNRIFVVRDRMAKRHQARVDVWMKEYHDAKQFGVRTATIEIVTSK